MNDTVHDIPRTGGRVAWIDIMRGIAILLMILCHLSEYGTFPQSLYKLIYVFHVPVFFFVTGCVEHFDVAAGKFIRKKINTLLIPYFILFLASHPHVFELNRCEKLPGVVFDLLTGQNVDQFWFLPTLFFTELLFKLIYDLSNKYFPYWTVILALIGISVNRFLLPVHLFQRTYPSLFWHLDAVPIVLLFMYLGHVSFRKGVFDRITRSKKRFYGTAFLCLLITLFSAKFNSPVDIHLGRYGNFLWFYIGSCAGIFLTALFSLFLERRKIRGLSDFLILAGKNSLTLLAFHWLFGGWFSTLLSRAEKSYHFAINGYIRVYVVFLAGILMTLPLMYILNRFFPFAVGRHKAKPQPLPAARPAGDRQ